ncbi:MAG: hypothetical protein U9O94_03225, partial [Nanoarchaeota archaeon]|nr:hypothetical protein [Nanoarchaeota archaeon]
LEYNSNPLVGGYKETYNTSYSYDTNDNLIKITDNEGNEFKFSYDSLGRKIKLEDPDLGTWTYSYDAVGNLVSQNDSVGNVITMSYDVLNRVLNKNSTDVNISFAYDGQYYGTLSNITMSNIGYRYTYDERLRLTKFEKNLYGTWKSKDNSYDSADRIIQKILPRGELEYYYNKQGKVYKINNYITDSDFNAFGSILNRTYNNGKTATFAYDSSNNRLTSISIPSVQNLQYTHDNVGNIMSILDSIQSRNYSMGYDSLSRLINTTINNGLYQYEYDSIGNIKRIVRAGQAKRLIYKGEIPHAPSQVIDSDAGVGAYNAKDIDSGSKNRTVEFFLVRENLTTQNDINWSIDFGDGNIVNSSEKVNVSSPIMVLVQHNYANGGSYDLNISTVYDWNIFEDKFGISAKSLQSLSNNRTLSLIEFIIENDISENATNVQWNCTNGITSSQSFDILGNEDTMVLIEYNYSTSGDKSLNCKAISDDGTGNKTTEFDIKGLEIKNFNLTDLDTNKKKIEFEIYNHYYPLTANWEIKSDGQTFTGSVDLNTSQSSNVTQEITYTTDGDKTANISIYSSSIRDSEEYTFNIKAFEIDRYVREDYNNDTSRIISFVVTNEWPSNLSVSWNLTDPSILNSTYLDQNDTLMVIIQENYTSEGKKEPTVNVYSGTFLTTLNDWFNIYLVEMLDLQTLSESVTSTITELITRSNSGNKTISWQLDTGEENITSDQTISLNQSQAIILIEHNYTTSGVYVTNASINDSSNQDNAQGVAIT